MDHSWGYGSDQRLREENQDSHGVFELPEFTLAVVCDGMGGHVGGAQASALAVRTIHDTLYELQGRPIPQAIEQAIERTNLVIYEAARKNHRLMGMGTTAVVAAITDDACYLAHVGDSRAYLLRNGQVQQLTRDHTMVNLFVDAELLSPEDAATHPEAHVLSRSLGVERQVDVEIASPIRLEPGDVVFLCSDGVHGVVTDWELANVEWGAPHAGVQHVLSIVSTREGDDNATAVAVLMGTSFEDVPPTGVPEPRRFEDIASPTGGVTAVPAEDGTSGTLGGNTFNTQNQTPLYLDSGAHSTPPAGAYGGAYPSYDEQPVIQPPPQHIQPMPEMLQQQPSAPPVEPLPPLPPPQAPAQTPQTPPRFNKQANRRALTAAIPVVIASSMLLIAVAAVLLILLFPGGDEEPRELAFDQPLEAPSARPEPRALPPMDPEQEEGSTQRSTPREDPAASMGVATADPSNPLVPTQEVPEQDTQEFILFDMTQLPPPPRRIPHRVTKYTQPPPGGQLQYVAVQAARRRDCPEALDAVQRGMRDVSIDHAVLYKGAWLCFTEAHQRPLEQTVSDSWEDFRLKLVHIEGKPEDRELQARTFPTIGRLPEWYRPATGGLEYRIEQFTLDDQMEEVVVDLFGEQKVADALFLDLYIEARAAVGLSRAPERGLALEKSWARRVYVLASSLQKSPGRLLDEHRKSDLSMLRQMLNQATTPFIGLDGRTRRVPPEVLRAKRVAEGDEEPPRGRKPKVNNSQRLDDYIERTLRDPSGTESVGIHGGN